MPRETNHTEIVASETPDLDKGQAVPRIFAPGEESPETKNKRRELRINNARFGFGSIALLEPVQLAIPELTSEDFPPEAA